MVPLLLVIRFGNIVYYPVRLRLLFIVYPLRLVIIISSLCISWVGGLRADIACWIFMAYYVVCLAMNWWYYDRKNSGISC